MDFSNALNCLKTKSRMRRWSWEKDQYLVIYADKCFIMLHNPDGTEITYKPIQIDILAEDWEEY